MTTEAQTQRRRLYPRPLRPDRRGYHLRSRSGLTRSDTTYDVVHVRHGMFFRLSDHLDRFETNMRKRRLTVPE